MQKGAGPQVVRPHENYAGYYAVNGVPTLLLGFDLTTAALPMEQLLRLGDRLVANGGNYLRLPPIEAIGDDAREGYRLLESRGIVIDTADTLLLPSVNSVAALNRQLLGGAAGGCYSLVTQRGLNNIRAIRTLERHVKFWDLSPAPAGIVVGNRGAMAAITPNHTYVAYLSAEGAVTLTFQDTLQEPRRVTVIGHLGTQRSEILEPPYDQRFTIQSNEERGGWMLIELLPVGR